MSDRQGGMAVYLYDTTLRDGAQRKGVSFSLNDKLRIASLLDDFGVPFVEGGWPGSNPKDSDFFSAIRKCPLSHAKVVAFGSTRRKGSSVDGDGNLNALLGAETPVVALVGKAWDMHVEKVLGTSLEENVDMIAESVAWMADHGREVVFDAEHFFDGFNADREYALKTLLAAVSAGAAWLCLCDTNGGNVPSVIQQIVQDVHRSVVAPFSNEGRSLGLGIHAHNDCELAVANSLAAVEAGCTQVQGTINGYGERCGNANLVALIPTLQLKMGKGCIRPNKLAQLTELSHTVSEIANLKPDSQAAYVGSSAFAHKGGIHGAAVERIASSYEHIAPELVGNQRQVLVSELSGKGNIRMLAAKLGYEIEEIEGQVLDEVKRLEAQGFQFENAEGSLELLIQKTRGGYKPPFEVAEVLVVSEKHNKDHNNVQAIVKLRIDGDLIHTAAEGSGPVHALDGALRKALMPRFPDLAEMHLTDYKVRILDPEQATAAITRVMIEATFQDKNWNTVGCSENIIDASLHALTDSFEYYLLKRGKLQRFA